MNLLRLDVQLLEELEGHDLLLDVLHTARLLVSTGHLGELLPIVDIFEFLVMESVAIHLELLLDLVGESDEFETELRDDRVDVHIVEEGVPDCLFGGVSVDGLLEDLAETVPPSTKALGRVDDVAREAIEGRSQVVNRRIVVHLRIVELGLHLDQRLACLLEKGLVRGQRPDHHLVDRVKDLALPVVVVDLHLLVALSNSLEGLLLDGLQVVIADILVILHKCIDFLKAVGLEVVTELSDVHDFTVIKVNWANDARVLNCLHLLLNVASLLEDTAFGVLELLNLLVALLDVL